MEENLGLMRPNTKNSCALLRDRGKRIKVREMIAPGVQYMTRSVMSGLQWVSCLSCVNGVTLPGSEDKDS